MTTAQTRKQNTSKGFTLIELLVVIAIIAILSVIGVAAFSGVATRGNDARRQSDLDAIAKTLEVNKVTAGYASLLDSQFASGKVPTDPKSGRQYCINAGNIAAATSANWTAAGACTGAGWVLVAPGVPAAGTTKWSLCVLLEDGSTVKCAYSAQ